MTLTIYSRAGCHLCDEMKATVARAVANARRSLAIGTIEEIDISTDPQLEARYGEEIPVLLIDGKKVAKYRISEPTLLRAIAERAGQAGGAGGDS